MDINQYLEIFVEESQEHLEILNQSLLSLESHPNDMKLLNEIFRVAHTIKGMAGTMGFTSMMNLTHEMENVLDAIRKDQLKVDSNLVDILFECFDYLEGSIAMVAEEGKEDEVDIEDLKIRLSNLLKDGDIKSTDIIDTTGNSFEGFVFDEYEDELTRKAIAQGMEVYKVKVILNKDCMLKSARAFIVFKTLEKYAEIFKSSPKVEDIEDEKFDREFNLAIITSESIEVIEKDVKSILEIEDAIFQKVEKKVQQHSDIDTSTKGVGDELLEIEKKEDHKNVASKIGRMGKTVRVDIDRLDNLMNLVSELIIIKTRLEGIDIESRDQNMVEAVEYLERITTSLHDAVMKVRMVPIERVFNRFPRMVRDLSRELDKEIVLDMTGQETELDRTVIDEIGDPLIHLIRNSIDHGMENKEERLKNKKSVAGTISLRAYQDGNNVVIEVEDDGKGIDINRIKEKSIEAGLLNKSEADDMDDKDILEFLFKPGFSTSKKISDVSGRGVGLDVVKTKIESLGGAVEVETSLNIGSKFIIRLPLTLAIIQALLVNIGNEKYAIPLNSIREIIFVKTDSIRKVQGKEVVLHRDSVLPITRLHDALDIDRGEEKDEITVVVVKKGEKNSGFIVDNLVGQQEIVIKSLGKYLSGIKIIAGATILGDGQVALIIDTSSLI